MMNRKKTETERSSEPQRVGTAISSMLKSFRIEDKFEETHLINSWERIMGKAIAKRTTKIYISNKKLFVHLNSAPLKHELSMSKDKLLVLLVNEMGKPIINEVIIK